MCQAVDKVVCNPGYTADDSWIVRSSDGGHGETKGLITPTPK